MPPPAPLYKSTHALAAEAAIASDLPPYEMSAREKAELPLFVPHAPLYVQIRNHIVTSWHTNIKRYMTLEEAMKDVQVRGCKLLCVC